MDWTGQCYGLPATPTTDILSKVLDSFSYDLIFYITIRNSNIGHNYIPKVCLALSAACLVISEGLDHFSRKMHKRQAALEHINKVQRRLTNAYIADIFSGSNTLSSKTPKCLACPGPALLAPPHRASHRDLQLQHCLPTLRSDHPPCLDALLDHFRWKHLLNTTYVFALIRCWGHLSHFRNKKCSEQVSSPSSHDNWSHDPSPGTSLQFCH